MPQSTDDHQSTEGSAQSIDAFQVGQNRIFSSFIRAFFPHFVQATIGAFRERMRGDFGGD